jgi:hypothetical protein
MSRTVHDPRPQLYMGINAVEVVVKTAMIPR